MLYATAELFLPSGEILHQQVVETCEGVVVSFISFTCENHAMTFVPQIHLFDSLPAGCALSTACMGDDLYACVQDMSGSWILLD